MTPSAVHAWARSVAGETFKSHAGVLQVVAVHAGALGEDRVIRIIPETPKSKGDRLCLELARRWSDVIVLTGAILRAEPSLDYAWWGPNAAVGRALDTWRAEPRRGRDVAPRLLVVTRGRGLPLTHPVLQNPRTVLCVPADARVDPRLSHLPVHRLPGESGRGVLEVCRTQLGAERISIEAGPRLAVPLFEAPCVVDAVLCSRYRGMLPPAMLADEFVSAAALSRIGRYISEAQQVAGEDDHWSHVTWRKGPSTL